MTEGEILSWTTAPKRISFKAQNTEPEVMLWNLSGGKPFIFKTPLVQITTLQVSAGGKYLFCAGKDNQGRDIILCYDYALLKKENKMELISRQLSDFDIIFLKPHPSTPGSFLTGGKENIRFWKMKQTLIQGQNVVLNQNGRDKFFTDAAYEVDWGEEGVAQKVSFAYVSTASGELYKVSMKKTLEEIKQIHAGGITSIEIPKSKKFAIASSVNDSVRVYSAQFDSMETEIRMASPVA